MKSKMNFFTQYKNRRNFYAATLADTPSIPARIVKINNEVRLETYTTHTRYKNIYENGNLKSSENSFLDFAYQLSELKTWDVCLSISDDSSYVSTPPHFQYKYPFSTNFYEEYDKYSNTRSTKPFFGTNWDLYFYRLIQFQPDLLFAIPQAIWDEFISKLPHQHVVKKLNLSTHRHLYKSYNNICITYSNNNEKMALLAELNSQYHFFKSNYYKKYPAELLPNMPPRF